MNLRQRKYLVWSVAVLVGLAGAGILLADSLLPIRISDAVSDRLRMALQALGAPEQSGGGRIGEQARPDLAELDQLCAKDLRRPLTGESAAAGGGPNSLLGAALTLQLVGTVYEPEHSMAMLRKGDGAVVVCALGESVDDVGGPAVVTQIEMDRISVRYQGAVRELRVPSAPTGMEGFGP
jgi:hypothetical protein